MVAILSHVKIIVIIQLSRPPVDMVRGLVY
jgi:hypothetical protein